VEITDIRINLAENRSAKLQAFASLTIDNCFVIRDLKIISGTKGLFVAMPSRKLTARCPRCRCKNHLRAQYCNDCGTRMRARRTHCDDRGRAKLHADIAHPINQACRDHVQEKVIEAFRNELERASLPGYTPSRDYLDDAGPEGSDDEVDESTAGKARNRRPDEDAGDMGIFS
jgi:stage V sporulation protein G